MVERRRKTESTRRPDEDVRDLIHLMPEDIAILVNVIFNRF